MVLEEVGRNLEGEDRNYDNFPSGMRVLAVDGDPVCLKVLECLLRKCGYQVTTRSQATMALKMLRENKDRFDLVISDVHLPDMDGFKFLELIGLEMDLPVIMLSANSDTKLVMRGITYGACDYLVKPVRIKELRNIWQHVIRREKFHWKTQSESAPNLQILDRSEMNLQLQSSNSGRNTDQAFPFDIDSLWAMERGGNKLVCTCENEATQDDGNAKQNVGGNPVSVDRDASAGARKEGQENVNTKQNIGARSVSHSLPQQYIVVEDINGEKSVRTEHDDANGSRIQGKIWTLDKEYGIRREVLEQHSGKKLKDVAAILGVSRSTLKHM